MKPWDIYIYIILAVHATASIGAIILLRLLMKKKHPDKKMAGEDRPSV